MRVVPSVVWSLDADPPEAIDARLIPLLDAVAASASLREAVEQCGISYRAAWGLLRRYERTLGAALVRLERGRGASLAPAGEALLAARSAAERRLKPVVAALVAEIGADRSTRTEAPLELRVSASHDLSLAAWADTLADTAGLRLEISFMGSLNAIEEFAAGRADVAGFHVPIAGCATLERKPFLKWLRGRRDRLLRFVDREQGLILPRGNPAGVRSLRDVAAKRLRFINRQRGSGTRLLVDQLLADGRVDKAAVAGYRTEEFTHAAVAATVASGGADAGFGLRAAAAEYRLAFVPLVRERYFLAVRAQSLDSPAIVRLLEALHAPAFASLVRSLPGYRTAAAGSIMLPAALVAREA